MPCCRNQFTRQETGIFAMSRADPRTKDSGRRCGDREDFLPDINGQDLACTPVSVVWISIGCHEPPSESGFAVAPRRLRTAALVCQRLTGALSTIAQHSACHHRAQVGLPRTVGILFRNPSA
jgi:hypothetical protein